VFHGPQRQRLAALPLLATLACGDGSTGPAPLGEHFLFTSNRSGEARVYAMRPDGSGVRALTGSLAFAPLPSPDGRRLLVFTQRGTADAADIMNADGSARRPFQDGYSMRAAGWSPDGERIAFVGEPAGVIGLYLANADGSQPTLLSDLAGAPTAYLSHLAWSPDGGTIAFLARGAGSADEAYLFGLRADGTALDTLSTLVSDLASMPAWAPDGQRVAFSCRLPDGPWYFHVCVAYADGRDAAALTTDLRNDVQPAWSPDGAKIAFAAGEALCCTSEVNVINADGTGLVSVPTPGGTVGGLHWSADGSQLAFSTADLTSGDIFVAPAAGGGEARNLTNTPSTYEFLDAWSPGP
jgi:TolB protein